MTPLQSLAVKFILLAAAVGIVVVVGWPVADRRTMDPVGDGHQISKVFTAVVPSPVPPDQRPAVSHRSVSEHAGKLDLNRATAEQLQDLPGVGEILAQRVVAHRKAQGLFRSLDELLEVKGIGRKRLERLRPLLTVSRAKPAARAETMSPASLGGM